jgi:putative CocE/NonD family hydrolase
VPTLYVASQWDQEDSFGAIAAYEATSAGDPGHRRDFLVIGPWSHGGGEEDGSKLGAISFDGDTGRQYREQVLRPFLDHRLKDAPSGPDAPPISVYETGSERWIHPDHWPISCDAGCRDRYRPLYLQIGGGLGFTPPGGAEHSVDYVSDPAKPIPYRSRPIRPTYADDSTWSRWLVDDQREFASRPDVVSWTSEVLREPIRIGGAPRVHLRASTTGADADWVVKLIDVYPGEDPAAPALGGYQLMIAADIFRGRYRDGYSTPRPITPGEVETFTFTLPNASHVFLPGHRIMVQIQSSWFPLYDRNPQTWVDNIFFAKAGDYRAATQHIVDGGPDPTYIDLPVVGVEP